MKIIDLRSDTVTQQTQAMRDAMLVAEVGDDVYRDDPTVNELEKLAAKILGKEAALFVTSGTMGNQLALMAQTRRGDEVIVSANCHIFEHEVGGAAVLSGACLTPKVLKRPSVRMTFTSRRQRSSAWKMRWPTGASCPLRSWPRFIR